VNKDSFRRAVDLLRELGYTVAEHKYMRRSFGSWHVTIDATPQLRIVWDGKEGWLRVDRKDLTEDPEPWGWETTWHIAHPQDHEAALEAAVEEINRIGITGKHRRLSTDDFWRALEFRLTRELEQHPDDTLRVLWCMGIHPDPLPWDVDAISGVALISADDGNTFEQYRFRFHLPKEMHGHMDIDWLAVLPSELAHGWLTVNPDEKWIEIRP
jgi:hypothetical protein